MTRRLEKVNELLQQELAKMIQQELADQLGMISVNFVETSPDLQNAKVYISSINQKLDQEKLALLQSKAWDFQNQLAKKMKTKYIPKLKFVIDQRQEKVNRIEELFDKIKKEL